MFSLRNIHKYAWTSPDGKTYNQIDNILLEDPIVILTIIWWMEKNWERETVNK